MKNYFFRFVLIYIVLNIGYFVFALFVSHFSTLNTPASMEGYLSIHKQNDSFWYETIYEKGYPEIRHPLEFGYNLHNGKDWKLSEWAFFPMYPLLAKGVSAVTSLNFDYSCMILSFIFGVLCFYAFFLISNEYVLDKKKAFYITLIFIVFPFHYYYSMFYTEAIFLTLLIFCFLSIKYRRYLIFCLLSIPLVLLRPNGLFVLLPLFLYFLEQQGILSRFSVNFQKITYRTILLSGIFLVGFIAFGVYLIYQYQKTNFYFAFSKAQIGWSKQMMFPLFAFFREKDLADYVNSLYAIAGIFLFYFVWKRFQLSLNVLVWITFLMPLMAGSSVSMPRYISILFPVFIIIGEYFYKFKHKYLIIGALLFFQLIIFKYWLFAARLSY